RATLHHARLTEHITPYDPVAQGAVSLLGPSTREQSLALVNQMITQQGYQMSFNEIFHGLGWIFLALIAITWLTRPPFVAKAVPAAAGGPCRRGARPGHGGHGPRARVSGRCRQALRESYLAAVTPPRPA